MTLSRRQKPTSIIILMMVIYTAAFLLHDLTHCQAPLVADPAGEPCVTLTAQDGNGTTGGETQVHPAQERHHCPFCNGFTGSVTVAILPPQAGKNGKPPLPPTRPDHGETLFSSIARGPPSA